MTRIGEKPAYLILALTALALLVAGIARGADDPLIIGGGSDNKSDAEMMVGVDKLQKDDAGVASNGREYKAGDAKKTANAGKAAAIAAGTAFLASGLAKIPFLPTLPAGLRDLAKSALEFAQAAASAGNASQNGGQKDLLTAEAGQSGNQAKGNNADTVRALSENRQIVDGLTKLGVNSDNFINSLVSGEFRDEDSIMRALGVSADSLAASASEGPGPNLNFAGVSGNPEPLGNPENLRVLTDELNKSEEDKKAGEGGGAVGRGFAAGVDPNGTEGQKALAEAAAHNGGAANALNGKFPAGFNGKDGVLANGLAGEMDPRLAALLGLGGTNAKNALSRYSLAKLGIIKLRPKENIFQLAHRNFRSFQKWRKTRKIARAPKAAKGAPVVAQAQPPE